MHSSPVPLRVVAARQWLAIATLSTALGAQIPIGGLDASGVSDSLSELYPARVKTFVKASSDPDERPTAPSRGNDDGFTGLNGVESYRETVGPDTVAVLADVRGRAGFMGCFFRNYWSGLYGLPVQAQEMNRTQILVDGTIRHDLALPDFHRSVNDPRGQVAPFSGFFTGNRAGGHLTHTPIAWQDEFQLRVFENSFNNAGRFHKVCGSLDTPEGQLQVPDLSEWETVAAQNGGWPHKSPRVVSRRRFVVPADGGVRLVRLDGPSTILELTCKVGRLEDFEDLVLRITWDGLRRPSVDLPVRFLGGLMRPPFSFPVQSLLFNNNGVDTITCYFPMHFREKAQLEFWNTGGRNVRLDLDIATVYGAHPDPWGYFSAFYHRAITQTGVSFRGPHLRNARGMLRAIMLETIADSTDRIPNVDLTHLEGDLCVRINGNRGDDHVFAASETSIGKWGWYGSPSDVPFATDCSFNSTLLFRTLPSGVVETDRMMGSTFVFDPIHFVSGIDIVLEHGVQNVSNADYGLVTLFYLQHGAAREEIFQIDVADAASEAAANVQFGSAPSFRLLSNFFRDQFFQTAPLDDEGRHVQDWYRFTVPVPAGRTYAGFCVAFRLDRERQGDGGICQADVLVDGQPAGLLHSSTSNALNRWKEGGELEVELPRSLTDGRSSFVVEVRPGRLTEPFRVGDIKVYGYTRG